MPHFDLILSNPDLNKSEWTELDPRPWETEPDKVFWFDEVTGYDCCMIRTNLGIWCGYVAVDSSHILYKSRYNELDFPYLDVHGGVTYSGFGHPAPGGTITPQSLCPYPELNVHTYDEHWWIGFDCAHAGDLIPGIAVMSLYLPFLSHAHYHDINAVYYQTCNLALQLHQFDHVDDLSQKEEPLPPFGIT
jgi:hypothetical protein